jgi:4-hydroxy-2-oxoheptanedioate aldolase
MSTSEDRGSPGHDPIGVLRARLEADERLFCAWCTISEPSIAEMLVSAGFDTAVLDMQHGALDFAATVGAITGLARVGRPAVVRIGVGDFAAASRILDMGAAGVIAPMINSVDDARRLVAFTKFPPMGERSFGPGRAQQLTGLGGTEYLQRANGLHLSIAMVETRVALDQLGDILDVPGIDGILIGPSDLSVSLSQAEVVDPTSPLVDRELDRVVAECRARQKFAMIACPDAERAAALSARGFHVCSMGSDQVLMERAARESLAVARRPG